jgi:hypothetical protein
LFSNLQEFLCKDNGIGLKPICGASKISLILSVLGFALKSEGLRLFYGSLKFSCNLGAYLTLKQAEEG